MDLISIGGHIYFKDFEELVNWIYSGVPKFLIVIFIATCVFAIFETILGWCKK